jgi:2-(1,2-epoxy-1,2-dihydrophenyl)acetyl-CoA isomerase
LECNEILFTESAGVFRITLNRPERLNAFNVAMHGEIADALVHIEQARERRVLLITGAGKGFCAGQDLNERNVEAGPLDLGQGPEKYYNPLIRRLAALPIPTVCAVNGTAAGAGFCVALACDIVIAKKSTQFVPAFARIGLVPDSGGTFHLPRLIGLARTLGFTLLGEALAAEKAEQWGLIWKAVDDDGFDTEVERLVGLLAQAPTFGLGATKRAVRESFNNTLDQQLALERDLQRECGRSDDYKEGVTAFKAKRSPQFKGR